MINSNKEVIYKPGNELFGIPVSFKDCFIVKGVDCTYGCAARCFKPYHYDGYQSEAIKRAGGLIFVKTSMP